ncbi:MAG TPA: alpha/beta hydrolase [Candidatus Limnocylindria bacterium]|jgi:pimeloyl-ACP methyl ester carboxylesterase|nr:alpha/beta hydrolase [Candidatus Limnocylindria bacterium]
MHDSAWLAGGFTAQTRQVDGRAVHYRIGGRGPAVLLLHGYADTGEMWAPVAPQLATNHLVVVPDLPGLGESRPQPPEAAYDMASVARTLHALMAQLGTPQAAVVGHDIGLMVAYAYAAQFPSDVTKLAIMDAPIPGVGPWQQVLLMPAIWHFHFNGTFAEELTAGRERIYLNRIWDDFAYHPERITEATRAWYAASYAQPGAMHAGFSYFAGFARDADDNVQFAKIPLRMPVLAMGGEKSFGALMPEFAKAVAGDVRTSVIPDSGHWLMDENPQATSTALLAFLAD